MVFPHLGSVPIREITVPSLVGVLPLIEARPAIETAPPRPPCGVCPVKE
ncbi:phage integrase central domain-containing protein [Rhizobium sp. LjRoot258]